MKTGHVQEIQQQSTITHITRNIILVYKQRKIIGLDSLEVLQKSKRFYSRNDLIFNNYKATKKQIASFRIKPHYYPRKLFIFEPNAIMIVLI